VSACDEDEDEMPTTLGRVDAGKDEDDDVPGFYIPDPELRSGFRIWWVKREKPGGPPRRQMGFR
jgi:hypothetical protein